MRFLISTLVHNKALFVKVQSLTKHIYSSATNMSRQTPFCQCKVLKIIKFNELTAWKPERLKPAFWQPS